MENSSKRKSNSDSEIRNLKLILQHTELKPKHNNTKMLIFDPDKDEKKQSWNFGRSPDADVVLLDVIASRKHVTIRYDGQNFLAQAHKSVNGVYVDNRRLSQDEETPLTDSCVFSLGTKENKTPFTWTVKLVKDDEPARKRVRFDMDDESTSKLDDKQDHIVQEAAGRSGKVNISEVKLEQERTKPEVVDQEQIAEETAGSSTKENIPDMKLQEEHIKPEIVDQHENDDKRKKEESKVVEKFQEKLNTELSCSICNEIFISVTQNGFHCMKSLK